MKKTIDTDVITDEMLYAGVYAAERCSDAGITDLKDVIYDAIFAALKAAPAVEPAQAVDLNESEQYRIQMEAISTASFGYWKEKDSILPEYDTVPLRDVAKLYQKYDALYKAKLTPSGWLRAIDEALVMHDVDVANADDDYATAKDKLNKLLCVVQDIGAYFAKQESAQSAAEPVASSFAPHMRFITNDELTEFQERNRARLEKSRLIDSPPTVPPAIDDETKRMALDFVRWIASLKIGGFIEARANDLLRLLEAGNGE